LKSNLPELSWITVYETSSCGASYDGGRYRIWKELTLDSALQLKHAPLSSPLRRIHGHTYTLRLHLCAPLDQVMGWAVEFGDVKEIFNPIFQLLDHQPLHEIPDLSDCDTASIAAWILGKARLQLHVVVTVALTCFFVFVNNAPAIRHASFFMKVLGILAGTALGTIGALIGNALRKAVHPDAVFTTGGFWSLVWVKVFWKWGPQTIGMCVGSLVAIGLVVH
jgi:6-pyruvoyl-tetrahydropterin synthase